MDKKLIVTKTIDFIKDRFKGEGSGHDWWHIYRVYKNALNIAKTEKVDVFVVELGALLHDIADWKFTGGNEKEGGKQARLWLENLDVDSDIIDHVCYIVDNIGFKGGTGQPIKTKEGMVVQDADRLDAMGAIGIARAFSYGGHNNREMYNPEIKPKLNQTKEEYRTGNAPTINHFYEKLLKLKDLINTKTGKEIAQTRHDFMESYLKEFFEEWEGKA
jgi:uncharacterized protein